MRNDLTYQSPAIVRGFFTPAIYRQAVGTFFETAQGESVAGYALGDKLRQQPRSPGAGAALDHLDSDIAQHHDGQQSKEDEALVTDRAGRLYRDCGDSIAPANGELWV